MEPSASIPMPSPILYQNKIQPKDNSFAMVLTLNDLFEQVTNHIANLNQEEINFNTYNESEMVELIPSTIDRRRVVSDSSSSVVKLMSCKFLKDSTNNVNFIIRDGSYPTKLPYPHPQRNIVFEGKFACLRGANFTISLIYQP